MLPNFADRLTRSNCVIPKCKLPLIIEKVEGESKRGILLEKQKQRNCVGICHLNNKSEIYEIYDLFRHQSFPLLFLCEKTKKKLNRE